MAIGATGPDASAAYLELGILLLALGLAARLAVRAGLSPVGVYLLGGVLVGALDVPGLSGPFIEFAAGLGVVLLLFLLGLEYTPHELTANLRTNAPAGIVDFVLNFTPGAICALLLGWSTTSAVLLGGVTWISSSSIVAKTLGDLGRLGNRETPVILAVLVLEDLAMTIYLPLVAALLVGGGFAAALGSVALAVLAAGAAFALALRHGAAVERLVEHRSEEVVLLTALGFVLVVAGGAELLHISAGVGAFVAGVALSGEVAGRAEALLQPIRDFNVALFFLFFGLQIELAALGSVLIPVLSLAVVTAVTKAATGWWAARRAGIGARGRVRAATALIPRGEFSIVIAGLAGASGSGELPALAAGYVLVLAVVGPALTRLSN
ncbi:MAG: potassium transporter [Gaiellaceae bacterium]|jgi:CPA2 family monovalent cation:H+ antiporter-2|nr:MAG: potassium transporter [Gaiellaceae bacterium]